MTRVAPALPIVAILACGCAFDRSGVGEPSALLDGAFAADETSMDTVDDTGVVVDGSRDDDTSAPDAAAPDTSAPDASAAPDADSATDSVVDAPVDTGPTDTAPPDPLYLECESGAFFGGMLAEMNVSASAGWFASVPITTTAWTGTTGAPPTRVELTTGALPAGTWYVWVSMYGRAGDSDAMYVGVPGGTLRRFFTTDWGKFVWVGAEGSGARLQFTLAGVTKLFVGAGEPGTGCDRVALTRNVAWTPP